MDTSHALESFRGLLLRHRGRTGLTQRELATRAGVSLRSVQDWEAGVTLPTAERLQAIVRALLEAQGLTPGLEMAEARELWTAVQRAAPRMQTPFDEEWFAALLVARGSAPSEPSKDKGPAAAPGSTIGDRTQDWGEAPDIMAFVGRADELALLQRWLLEERCRLVAVLGMGGIGKTSLAAWAAQKVAPSFERVYWRSLRNAPPVSDWLAGAIGFLSDQQVLPPATESERITALLQVLRARRCLLVLDNSETLFEPGQQEGRYRAGMEGYGRVLQVVGESSHQSCLLLTSREAPPELAVLGGGVRALELYGLGTADAQALLADKQLIGDAQAWVSLVERYGGNGLALKIVGERIRQVYDGDVAGFVGDAVATEGTVFGGIRRLLDAQAERLSPMERDVLTRLAVGREPISMAELSAGVALGVGQSTLIEAVETLRRRSFVEPAGGGARFTLQSMVLEYVTDRLVETVADEIRRGEPVLLVEQPLIQAQAKDHVRQTQERLIGVPILQWLKAQHAHAEAERQLIGLLDAWRGRAAEEQGAGPGNVVNLLRLLRGDLRGLDLSRLTLRQVYLQGVKAQDASLAGAHLAGAVLDEPFAYPTAVALSGDGALLAAVTPTGEVRLWRVADRTLLMAAQGHTGMVWDVALSGDGRLVASAGEDGTVRLWETISGQLLASLEGHTGGFRVALSRDGRLVAGAGRDGAIRVWEWASRQLLATLQGHTGSVRGVAFSGDGRLVASGGIDGSVRLWELKSGQPLALLHGHAGMVFDVALSADGRLVAGAGEDGTVRLWEATSGQLLATLEGHIGPTRGVALSDEASFVASSGADGMIRLWDATSGQLVAALKAHAGPLWGLALSGDGRLVASGGDDGAVRLWEAPSGQLLATIQGDTGMILDVALSGDGELVASGGMDGSVRLWGVKSGQLLATLHGHTALVQSVAFSGDGELVASGSWDGSVRLWEVSTGQHLATWQGHTGAVFGVGLSQDGRLVASGGQDGTVRLWTAGSTRLPTTVLHHAGPVYGVVLSGDGRLVASGGQDGTVTLWETGSGQIRAARRLHTDVVWGVALSGDGQLLASGGLDGTVHLSDGGSGQVLAALHGHTGAVLDVDLSGDGRLAASGSMDGTVRLWEMKTAQPLATLHGHTGAVWGVALSDDGRLLASGGDDGTVRLWETGSGACLRTLRSDRHYQRLDITGLTGVTEAQRAALLELGAFEASV